MNWLIEKFLRMYFRLYSYNVDPKRKVDYTAIVAGVVVGSILAAGYLALSY